MIKKEYISPELNVYILETMNILEGSDPSHWDITVPTEEYPLYGDVDQKKDDEEESL